MTSCFSAQSTNLKCSNDYFSDGLTEELTDALTRVEGLRVVARSSAFQFKGKTVDVREIGRRLNVNVVLEGSVRKSGNHVRITAQLNSAETGYHLWSRTWDREMNDVFAVQEEIAEAIAAGLGTPVHTAQGETLVRPSTRNLDAYNLYLLGRYYWNKRSEAAMKEALGYFERAVERDPEYALAFSGIADVYNVLPNWTNTRPKPLLELAKKAALKALALDGSLAEAHTSLGYALQHLDWDWEGGDREFQRAIQINRGYSFAHAFYCQSLQKRGLMDAALTEIRHAREADPMSPLIKAGGAATLYLTRRYVEAIEEARQDIRMNPGFFPPHRIPGMVHIQQGLYDEAINDFRDALQLRKDTYCLGRLGYAYARAGRRTEAMQVLEQLKAEYTRSYFPAYQIGVVYAGLGDVNQVFPWFEKACDDRDPDILMLKVEPLLDDLRSDPRFKDLLRRMHLAG